MRRAVLVSLSLGVAFGLAVIRSSACEQLPLPWKTGQVFMVDNFDYKVTEADLGLNFFSGNMGAVNEPAPAPEQAANATLAVATNSCSSTGGSLALAFDFNGYPPESFGGCFQSLLVLTDTKLVLDGSREEPTNSTPFPGYYLDFDDFYRGFAPWPDRTIDTLVFDVRLVTNGQPVLVKIELQDESGFDIFCRRQVAGTGWQTISVPRSAFTRSVVGHDNPAGFRWDQVTLLSLLVERLHVGDGVLNPVAGGLLIDNLRLVDEDGLYPDLSAARDPVSGSLLPQFRRAFLEHLHRLTFLFFIDFAAADPRTGGLIQDRGTFADLMSTGGAGFQLTAYVIGAARGYYPRSNMAARVHSILTVLDSYPQGTNRVGQIGYRGFFYHFVNIDGLRKQNFDFDETPVDESLNTVELSVIETELILMGSITAARYFTGPDPIETEIREMADRIRRRVEWPFMLATLTNGTQQLFLGWKPNEERDDLQARFLLPDGDGAGHYSSRLENGVELPATLDFYTDEALKGALFAMAAPDLSNRLSRQVWDDIVRAGEPFVKTYPGALFTYQFLSCWLDTRALGPDNHPTRPVDFYENTRAAIGAARDYAIENPFGHAGLGSNRWGHSACEGPFDRYFAEAATNVALAAYGTIPNAENSRVLEGEDGTGDGVLQWRGNASNQRTRYLTQVGHSVSWTVSTHEAVGFAPELRYSNDGPADSLAVYLDGEFVGSVWTRNTRPAGGVPGSGWNNFAVTNFADEVLLSAGSHTVTVSVAATDEYGVEVDRLGLAAMPVTRPLETGTLAPYAVASSLLHRPNESIAALWAATQTDLNEDGHGDLLHARFGFADAYNLEIAHAAAACSVHAGEPGILRAAGAWLNPTGFAVDQGPMLLILDAYLYDGFVARLFSSDPHIRRVLIELFDGPPDIYEWGGPVGPDTFRLRWKGAKTAVVEATESLTGADWHVAGPLATNVADVVLTNGNTGVLRVRQVD